MGQTLVPDGLWEIVEPLLPPQRERRQGGGTRYVEDRAVFTAIVYVLTSGCAWRHLPAEFGVSKATAHRRFVAWTPAGLWRRPHPAGPDPPPAGGRGRRGPPGGGGGPGRGQKRGPLPGPNPAP